MRKAIDDEGSSGGEEARGLRPEAHARAELWTSPGSIRRSSIAPRPNRRRCARQGMPLPRSRRRSRPFRSSVTPRSTTRKGSDAADVSGHAHPPRQDLLRRPVYGAAAARTLVIFQGGNGDWYVQVAPRHGRTSEGVRLCTSGGASSHAPGLTVAIASAHRAIMAAQRGDPPSSPLRPRGGGGRLARQVPPAPLRVRIHHPQARKHNRVTMTEENTLSMSGERPRSCRPQSPGWLMSAPSWATGLGLVSLDP